MHQHHVVSLFRAPEEACFSFFSLAHGLFLFLFHMCRARRGGWKVDMDVCEEVPLDAMLTFPDMKKNAAAWRMYEVEGNRVVNARFLCSLGKVSLSLRRRRRVTTRVRGALGRVGRAVKRRHLPP